MKIDTASIEEFLSLLVVPEAILPGQLATSAADAVRNHGLARLRMAVLIQALSDYRRSAKKRREVRNWIRERSDREGPFSFVAICVGADIEADALRRRILGWMRRIDAGWRPRIIHRGPAGETRRVRARPRRVWAPRRRVARKVASSAGYEGNQGYALVASATDGGVAIQS